ncbi:ABC-2 type transporter-domain-containing protein [Sporodiniella umbellata]|nr:ABC-2 type transporter-domain-containing protein [Sporodiniella umbellata]
MKDQDTRSSLDSFLSFSTEYESIIEKESVIDIQAAKKIYQQTHQELGKLSRASTQIEQGDGFDLGDFLNTLQKDQFHAGRSPKKLGLSWRGLTVKGKEDTTNTIPTVISELSFWRKWRNTEKKIILDNLTGYCKAGEMMLVLGRPGAGCSTFLRVMANMRASYTDVDGMVSYGGIDAETFKKRYQGQACFNTEEDHHFPRLTLRQTLEFALRLKVPGKRLPQETQAVFVDKMLQMLTQMLGLTQQTETMVGNAEVRGLSGGERKRLSIAEQIATGGAIHCWDSSTRGLDSASALDFIKSLRIMTDLLDRTTFATLYQASSDIYHLFDKVLLLEQGLCLYFGPIAEAQAYFESLGFYCPPRKSVPDFLTGICNPLEREFRPGYETLAPKTKEALAQRFLESPFYQQNQVDLEQYEQALAEKQPKIAFAVALKDEHRAYAGKNTPYVASYLAQIKILTIRQYHLNRTNIAALISRYGTILVQALATASCFYRMPLDSTGAFSRGGALFFSTLFNAFVSQSELVSFLAGRPILEKHKQFALYRPAAFYLSQVVMDIPYAIAQVLLFQFCAYFMMGLQQSAARFFTLSLFLFTINMTMNGFFRFFGAATSRFELASQISGILLILVMIYTGYTLPYDQMHPWLSWVYWVNPLAYGYKGMLVNEVSGLRFFCDLASIPLTSNDWRFKTCLLAGAQPGYNYVNGNDYLLSYFDYRSEHLWAPNFIAVLGFFLFFTVMASILMEYRSMSEISSLTRLYLPIGSRPNVVSTKITEGPATQGTVFSWQDVGYTVPVKDGQRTLLSEVSGLVRPGHLTALMGSSGAGKTTLLDVLSHRKTLGQISGRLYLNNEMLMKDFERVTGYCEQNDVHQPTATVREALRFSAYLRQPPEVSQADKDAYVEHILDLLEMKDIADAQVGSIESGFGISTEERKRLTIGVELVGKPQLLFLDEPTSGLDSQSSYNIIRFVRKLADSGWPVLCTIHQPSAILFEQFDHLLLLVRGGRTAYYGEIGQDASTMIRYFESNGGPRCLPDANPAEYILDCVGAGTAGKPKADWAQIWQASDQAKRLERELETIHQEADQHPTRPARIYSTPYLYQFKLVMKRMTLAYWRSPSYNLGRLTNVVLTAFIIGFTYYRIGNSVSDLLSKVFALFGSFIMAMTLVILSQPKFMLERQFFRREYASRYYHWLPWGIAVILVEIPYIFFFSICFTLCFYWTTGMNSAASAIGYFYLLFTALVFWAVTFGFAIGAFLETTLTAGVLNPLLLSILILFAGLMQSPDQMPGFWRTWMYKIDPFHYYIEGLAVNELSHVKVDCSSSDLVYYRSPSNMTCLQYTTPFFNLGAPGYLLNPQATALCAYCPFSTGTEFFTTRFQWDFDSRWKNLAIMIGFILFNCCVFLIFVYLKRKPQR